MLIALVCPEEDLNSADFIITYVSENGEKNETNITKSDFKEANQSYLPIFLGGSTSVGTNEGDRYWTYRKHFETSDVHHSVFVEYAVKESNVFSSKAGFSVQTNDGDDQIDSFNSPLLLLNSTFISITIGGDADKNTKRTFWFGYDVNIDNNWKITASRLNEDDIPLMSNQEKAYLTEHVENLMDESYSHIDEILAALPNDSENEEENKVFVYSDKLPSEVFGHNIDIAWELTPYKSIISYNCKYKLEENSQWKYTGGALKTDEAKEKLKETGFRKKIIHNYEKTIYEALQSI